MQANLRDKIGGVFPPEAIPDEGNTLLASLAAEGDDVRHMMSGRCGIMLCIQDWMLHDTRRVAYLPAYTCETVSGCFYKCGYDVRYYDVDTNLVAQYDESLLDEISLFVAVGYFGFATFNEEFAEKCRAKGIGVMVDATHSIFTEGGCPKAAHYIAASLRKWLPVPCGGLAIKHGGNFGVQPVPLHEQHLNLRYHYFELSERALVQNSWAVAEKAEETFWNAEMLLREVYEAQGADVGSQSIVTHYPVEGLRKARRQNYTTLLEALPPLQNIRPVFRTLPAGTVPSHFTLYTTEPEKLQALLKQHNISSTAYWPVPPYITIRNWPGAEWVYNHVLSLPCDQRYGEAEMRRAAAALAACDTLL